MVALPKWAAAERRLRTGRLWFLPRCAGPAWSPAGSARRFAKRPRDPRNRSRPRNSRRGVRPGQMLTAFSLKAPLAENSCPARSRRGPATPDLRPPGPVAAASNPRPRAACADRARSAKAVPSRNRSPSRGARPARRPAARQVRGTTQIAGRARPRAVKRQNRLPTRSAECAAAGLAQPAAKVERALPSTQRWLPARASRSFVARRSRARLPVWRRVLLASWAPSMPRGQATERPPAPLAAEPWVAGPLFSWPLSVWRRRQLSTWRRSRPTAQLCRLLPVWPATTPAQVAQVQVPVWTRPAWVRRRERPWLIVWADWWRGVGSELPVSRSVGQAQVARWAWGQS